MRKVQQIYVKFTGKDRFDWSWMCWIGREYLGAQNLAMSYPGRAWWWRCQK